MSVGEVDEKCDQNSVLGVAVRRFRNQKFTLACLCSFQIQTEEKYVGAVMSDLSNRRSDILEMRADGTFRTVLALSPLAELTGYSTVLRTMTSGLATFSMDLAEYRIVDRTQQDKIIEKMTNYRCMF